MQKQWVSSLFLGTWHLPTGDVFECTPEARDFYFARSKEFFNRGLPMPVCLEHQPTVGLSFHDRLAEQTRHTVGHCHDVRIGDQGQLQFLVDGDDEAFAIMRRNKYVSPEIRQNVMDPRTGERFSGPSIVHLAITPRPIQVTDSPHVALSARSNSAGRKNRRPIGLHQTAVDVSLSSAVLMPQKTSNRKSKDQPMAAATDKLPPELADDDTTDAPLPVDEPAQPDSPPVDAGGDEKMSSDEALAMAELEREIAELGISFHDSASGSLLQHLQHLITALKTHKATKNGDSGDNSDPEQRPADDNPDNPDNPLEPEVAESPPIMMSQAPLTPREQKAVAKILKDAKPALQSRIKAVHTAGFIDDAMRRELEAELGTVKLSATLLTDDFDLKPLPVTYKLDVLERLVKTGKPGPFAQAAPKRQANPNKPISSAVQLSAADDTLEMQPYPMDDDGPNVAAQERAGAELASLAGFPVRA